MCRQGASVIQTDVLDVMDTHRVRAYVVWVSMLPNDEFEAAREARRLVPDRRAMPFWDAGPDLTEPFGPTLGLPPACPAWDVYLLYPAGVTWGEEPPAPAHWQHQLPGVTGAPLLDGGNFAEQLRSVLRSEGT